VSALARVTALAREVDLSLADAAQCDSTAAAAAERLGHLSAAVGAFCGAAEAVRVLHTRRVRARRAFCRYCADTVLTRVCVHQGTALSAADGVPQRLRDAARARLGAALAAARAAASEELRGALAAAGWPPPLAEALPSSGVPWRAGAASAEAAAAAARVPEAASLLDALCAAACAAGVASRPRIGWCVCEVACPLRERLNFHFTSGGPADQAERPEWLLVHTLRCARAYGPAAAAMLPPPGPSGAAQQAPHEASLAAALAEEAAAVLRRHVLPALHARGGSAGPAWVHLADEALSFDASLAALAGAPAAAACGAVRVLVEKAEWEARWTAAELEAALTQLDDATDCDDAWALQGSARQRGAGAGGDGGSSSSDEDADTEERRGGDAAGTPGGRSGVSPVCAARALAIVRASAARARALPHASRQRAFLRDVPAAVAADFLRRAQRHAHGAHAFGELGRAPGLARAAACVSAARAMQDGLEELGEAPELWEVETDNATPRSAGGGGGGGAVAAAAGAPAGGPARGGVFGAEVSSCAAFQDEWLHKMASAIAAEFAVAAAPYVSAVRMGADARRREREASPLLQPATDAATELLRGLAPLLEPLLLARCRHAHRHACMGVRALARARSPIALPSTPVCLTPVHTFAAAAAPSSPCAAAWWRRM
jgi:hypothetical protein